MILLRTYENIFIYFKSMERSSLVVQGVKEPALSLLWLAHCCGVGSILVLGTSSYYGYGQNKKPKILPLEATTCLLKWLKLKLLTEPIANEDAEQWNFSYIVGENVKCYLCVNIHNSFLCKSSRIRSTQIQWVNE